MKKLLAFLLPCVMLGLTACAFGRNTQSIVVENPVPIVRNQTPEAETQTQPETEETPEEEDVLYVPVVVRAMEHQFWKTFAVGAMDAAEDYAVEVRVVGTDTENQIAGQVDLIWEELAKDPKVIAIAPQSLEAVQEILQYCEENGIPVIGCDSSTTGESTQNMTATVGTDNVAAAAVAADMLGQNETLTAALAEATPANPVVIGCLAQDTVSKSTIDRVTGFVDRMTEIAAAYGTVSVEGNALWENRAENPAIIVQVAVPTVSEMDSLETLAGEMLKTRGLKAVFCSAEGVANAFLAATSDGTDLAEGGKYADLSVVGFDAGETLKNAVRQGWFLGAMAQDPYMIGYYAVALAVQTAQGETVSDVDTGAQWYCAENMDDARIAALLYD